MSGSPWLNRLLSIFGHGSENENWHERSPEDPLSESDRFLIDALPFERIEVGGHEALAEWKRLMRERRGYPVIIGKDENLIRLAEQWSIDDRTPEDILAAAKKLSPPDSIFALRAAEAESARKYLAQFGEDADEGYQAPLGNWPDPHEVAPNEGPSIVQDFRTGEPEPNVHLLLLPISHGYEAPAYLRWGGWNECPPPEFHVAAMLRWQTKYEADLVAISGDVVELLVRARPESREEALELAREHYAYCPDIVDQGVEDICALAATLMASDWWYFWWD